MDSTRRHLQHRKWPDSTETLWLNSPTQTAIEQVSPARNGKNTPNFLQILQAWTPTGFCPTSHCQMLHEMTLTRLALLCLAPLSHETPSWISCLPYPDTELSDAGSFPTQPAPGWVVRVCGSLEQAELPDLIYMSLRSMLNLGLQCSQCSSQATYSEVEDKGPITDLRMSCLHIYLDTLLSSSVPSLYRWPKSESSVSHLMKVMMLNLLKLPLKCFSHSTCN